MAIAYIGLGSNLGDREENIRKALDHLRERGVEVLTVSRLIETEPEGGPSQPDFLNGAARIRTSRSPRELMALLTKAERAAGRQQTGVRWGPREADLDLLLYDDRIVRSPDLIVPHPRMRKREFVLAPLAEIAPNVVDPEKERTVKQLLEALRDEESGRHRVRLAKNLDELADYIGMAKRNRFTIGLVPTMGAFHEGHLSLMRYARKIVDLVVVSLFVNPTQFGPDEDLESYPRPLEEDLRLASQAGVDLVFTPQPEEMYPPGPPVEVEVAEVTEAWCGKSRPGHFRGVATVVLKLFNLVRPDLAFFGQKDYQQSVVLRRMVEDLFLDVDVRILPTLREPDGLAMSSRNAFLSPEDRQRAAGVPRAIFAVRKLFDEGEFNSAVLIDRAREILGESEVDGVEYVAVVDPKTLRPVDAIETTAVIMVAVWISGTRLIDNLILGDS